jgi:riboflavin kinase/FMN adenylyltransferase
MNIYWGLDSYDSDEHTIVIGNFDGLHLGHLKLLEKAYELKPKTEKLGVITFYPHPESVLRARGDNFSLTTIDEKIKIFEKSGVHTIFFTEFTSEFSRQDPEQFVDYFLNLTNIKRVVVGENFKFGKNGKGNAKFLQEKLNTLNINVDIIPLLKIKGTIVSSTLIRNCIHDRFFKEAEDYLGRDYIISGIVMYGKSIGKKIGFPTANLNVQGKILPQSGVYSGSVYFNEKKYFAMIFIGTPMLRLDESEVVEVWIENFDLNIYGRSLSLHIEKYIRPVKKIDNLKKLKKLIVQDLKKAKNEI